MSYIFGEFELDEQTYQLRKYGEVVSIEPQAFKLLTYLITYRDRAVSREELFDKLWPGQVVGDAALTYCVAKARKAVQDTGAEQRLIKTVHGYGYRFIGQVASREEENQKAKDKNQKPVLSPSTALRINSVEGTKREDQFSTLLSQDSGLGTQDFFPLIPSIQHPTSALLVPQPVLIESPTWLAPRSSLQSRQVTLLGCLLLFGWVTALWQVALQSSSPRPLLYSVTYQSIQPMQSMPELAQAEKQLCHWWVVSAKNRYALEALLKGWESYDRATPEAIVQARRMFQQALELDPTYAAAYASLGWMAWQDWLSRSQNPSSLEQASLYLQKAASFDSSCPRTITLLAEVMAAQRRRAQAIAIVEHGSGARHAAIW